MRPTDVACHVTALCAQTVEKALKGYLILNRRVARLDHRPDRYLRLLLERDGAFLRYRSHHPELARLFDTRTRSAVVDLLSQTPGARNGARTDEPNSEYPWQVEGEWRHAPADAAHDPPPDVLGARLELTRRVLDVLDRLRSAAERAAPL